MPDVQNQGSINVLCFHCFCFFYREKSDTKMGDDLFEFTKLENGRNFINPCAFSICHHNITLYCPLPGT